MSDTDINPVVNNDNISQPNNTEQKIVNSENTASSQAGQEIHDKKQSPYKVELDIFEGPLDLLLYLIKKDEVDIYNIPIETITNQYVEYIDLMHMLDLNIAGEFLVMASTLMYIKSKMLLPPEERPQEEVEEEDPRMDLVRQLLEYKKFKEAAHFLHSKEMLEEKIFVRHGPSEMENEIPMVDVNIFDLISAFNQALKKFEQSTAHHEVVQDNFSVSGKIYEIREMLKIKQSFSLTRLFDNMKSKIEVVVAFLALLELIRLKEVRAAQKELFGEIVVEKYQPPVATVTEEAEQGGTNE
jgi:segregation and condensation protein A